MKKVIVGFLFVAILLVIGNSMSKNMKNSKVINYKLEGKTYKLLVADTPELWEKGLMNVRKKNGFDGMIFIYPVYLQTSFWNKDTYVDLDIYWLQNDRVIGKDALLSIEKSSNIIRLKSPDKVNKVIEIIR